MNILFWICWVAEFVVATWWVTTELKLTHTATNPFSYLSVGYVLLVLAIRLGVGAILVSNLMVFIPAIPLVMMGVLILAAWLNKGRWN